MPSNNAQKREVISLSLLFEGTTRIDDVPLKENADGTFDLTGRKIGSIVKSGIYIKNGKKVIVK